MSPVEGHIALGATRENLHCFLVGYLNSHTGMAEEMETRELYRVHIHLEAY